MKKSRSAQWYEDNKEEILQRFYNNESIEKIYKNMECGRSSLINKLHEWGAERPRIKRQTRHNALYDIDYEYFDNIDCEHKAYWVGMLLADGFVNDKQVSLTLKQSDKELIEQFKTDLKAEHPIRTNHYGYPTFGFVCKRICDTLTSYGFHNHKSYSFDLDKLLAVIPEEYEHHFIRGMFDGDGSVRYYKYDYQKIPFFHLGYTGLKNICDYVSLKLDIDTIIDEGNNLTYTVRTHNPKKIIDVYNYLYKDATIYLERKYNTFQEIIDIERKRDEEYVNNGVNANGDRDRCRYITYNGETHSLKEWSEIRNINYGTLSNRINTYNWSIGRALEYE